MKKLKIVIRTVSFSLVMLSFGSCRIKNLDKQSLRVIDRQSTDLSIRHMQDENYEGQRFVSIRDSGDYQYRVNIFPASTFSFSIQDGFKGNASRIEVLGRNRQTKIVSDSNSFYIGRQTEMLYDRESESKTTAVSRAKNLEKRKSSILPYLLGLVLGVVAVWLGWRVWKRDFQE
ncbi:hypothetical protein [Daejeonella sp. JGW-45]|uniref:hypothetical protein n=1 Tax=Daejeonella sp. JGW-45 TaxID=3034148 RepID=UPI0023EAD2F3|nr:hypothetical protein [Daejeonella sp. JGW-45]